MNTPFEPCQLLQWDTEFFGYRIARLQADRLDAQILESVYAWSETHQIQGLYFLAVADDIHTIRLAEDHGFRLVEVRLNMERSLKDWDPLTRPKAAEDVLIRDIRPEDLPILQEIAATSYVDSRFYFDPHFSEDKWQAYYATWIKKSCQGAAAGGADIALAAEKDGQVVGYITGLIDKNDPTQGQYELTGVRISARKSGVGQELFRSGLDRYVQHGVQRVWLATQGRNVPTQRMVQRNGFITRSCQLYYHKWF
ncbi:MAG: GNAT family N-acetyltransferase [Chloroflexota bacterium]